MMSVLFHVGNKNEEQDVVGKLLRATQLSDRPNYDIAEGEYLILSDCGFEGIEWKNHNFYAELETFKIVQT